MVRKRQYSKKFVKILLKLKGKELFNVLNKIDEILSCSNLDHYKNLRGNLKKYKRVHVNNSYVILFYDNLNDIVFFEDYAHHDIVYKKNGKGRN